MSTPNHDTYLGWAKMIDHALLRPNLTQEDLENGIAMARRYEIATVCIVPYYLKRCTELLRGSGVAPSTTIGFPHGAHSTDTKLAEVRKALDDGAEELDMVVNISRVVSNDWQPVSDEIRLILELVRRRNKRLKVIFENAYLNDDQKKKLCEICDEQQVDWVKTSTGFASSGATFDDVALMHAHVNSAVQVKAAGGVRTFADLRKMKELGATRCGTSQTVALLEEVRADLKLPPLSRPDTATPHASY